MPPQKPSPQPAARPPVVSLRRSLGMGASLWRYFAPCLPGALGVLALGMLQADLLLGATALTQRLVDSFINPDAADSGAGSGAGAVALATGGLVRLFDRQGSALWLVGGAAALAVLAEAAGLLGGQWRAVIARRFRGALQARLVRALTISAGSGKAGADTALAQTMFAGDCGSLGMMLVFGTLGFIEQGLKLAVYAAGLCRLADGQGWQLAAALVPAAFLFRLGVMRLFLRWEQGAARDSGAAMMEAQRAALGFFPLLKRLVYLGGEAGAGARLLETAEAGARTNQRSQMVSQLHGSAAGLLGILALPVAALAMLRMEVSPGVVVQGQALFAAILALVGGLLSFPAQFIHFAPALERITTALAEPEPPRPDTMRDRPPGAAGGAPAVRFEEVSFSYLADDPPLLDAVSWTVPAGALVCVTGASGAGKSTLARLLIGESHPGAGRIWLDDAEVTDWHLLWRREWIGYLPAEVGLLRGTLEENLAFGREGLERERLREAAAACGLGEVLSRQGDRPLTAPETELSTGEQRRLGVARLLLGRQPVWVLDEPVSNLDPARAAELARAIQTAARGRTTLVITHDPHLFASAFNLFLHEGRLAAAGAHQDLLRDHPDYRRLFGRPEN